MKKQRNELGLIMLKKAPHIRLWQAIKIFLETCPSKYLMGDKLASHFINI
ncbi:hypothetical protein [Lysinibacillus sp. NPDC093692]